MSPDTGEAARPVAAFLGLLFRLLDRYGIRYVVLHSYEGLPERLPSDLDMAVHPEDTFRLSEVFGDLDAGGYRPVQCLNYAPDGHYFVFCWVQGSTISSAAVDFIQAHRRGGVLLSTGEELVEDRRLYNNFWIPAPDVEFSYLLAKKALKRKGVSASQQRRMRQLVEELGRSGAEQVAATLFGTGGARLVVDACLDGDPGDALDGLRGRLRGQVATRAPLDTLRQAWMELRRRVRRWIRPTGLFVAVLGPDGSGKSTLLDGLPGLLAHMQGPFRRSRVFHWRPMLIPGGGGEKSVSAPHRQQARPTGVSVLRALVHFADYWLGYWFRVRPALVRSSLVLFDRYADDMTVDPARYRYSNSMRGSLGWLSRMVPRPDVTLVLDVPPGVALARKQEIEFADAARLRAGYLSRGLENKGFRILDAAQAAPELLADAAGTLVDLLAQRFVCRERQWLRSACPAPTLSLGASRAEWWGQALGRLSRGGGTAAGTSTLRYLAVPSASEPRLLIPLEAPAALPASIDTYTPYALRARVAKALLHVAVRTGVARAAGDEIQLDETRLRDVRDVVRKVTGEDQPAFSLLLGTPGRRCNLTLKTMRQDGRTLGFLKVPVTEEAAERVRREATVLRILGQKAALRPHVPEVLFSGEWGAGYLLFQSPCGGEPGPVAFGEPHQRFLRTLLSASSVSRTARSLVEESAALWEDAGANSLGADWRLLARFALEEASSRLGEASVACGVTHGDFAPWNTRLVDGRLFVFDWEAAGWESPSCWDSFHFEIQVKARLGRGYAFTSNSCVGRAARQPAMWPLLSLYLLHSATGLARDGVEPSNRSLEVRKKLLVNLLEAAVRK